LNRAGHVSCTWLDAVAANGRGRKSYCAVFGSRRRVTFLG